MGVWDKGSGLPTHIGRVYGRVRFGYKIALVVLKGDEIMFNI